MFIVYLLTLKSILMFLWTFVVFYNVYSLSIDFEVYSNVSIDFEVYSDVSDNFCSLCPTFFTLL